MGLSKSKDLAKVRPDIPVDKTMPQEEVVRININVSKSVRRAWKNAASERDTTITDLIIEAMKKAHGL